VGDQVFGVTNSQFLGAYAEYAVASAGMLANKPRSLSYVEAASVPVIAVTAWQGLFDHARLESGQTVVIHGAAGNVGAFGVQFARRAGLRCIATAGAKDISYVRSLGADVVIDYRSQDFADDVKDADAVLDLVGGETQTRSFQVLRPGGKLISAVSEPDQNRARDHRITAAFFLVEVTSERLRMIAELIERGDVRPCVGEVMPLANAREAHMTLEGRRPAPRGKIVLDVMTNGKAAVPI
jgi:NADPH:quinone reductase-like Zn-dependent oxidoreductase